MQVGEKRSLTQRHHEAVPLNVTQCPHIDIKTAFASSTTAISMPTGQSTATGACCIGEISKYYRNFR
jgi:hypothetical protein